MKTIFDPTSQPSAQSGSCCGGSQQGELPPAPSAEELRRVVRQGYAKVAEGSGSCCGPQLTRTVDEQARDMGYSDDDLEAVPDGANLGLGCGNPTALAELRPGEVVVDLGAGAGLDAFIAAGKVGPEGRVIGIDMTPEMLARARENAVNAGVAGYVEFREGIIEQLPVVSESVDVILSNCVINLSPDKRAVFREAFRILKPGGRLAVSDIVLSEPLPADVQRLADAYVACVGGAALAEDYLGAIEAAGFVDVSYERSPAGELLAEAAGADAMMQQAIATVGSQRLRELANTVWSYKISARRP